MAHRGDLPFFEIPISLFEEFDKQREIEQWIPARWNLKPQDTVDWTCVSYDGIAEIVKCGEIKDGRQLCTLKKIN